ncbi:MAG: effector binding domain-containing protein [Lachnospiraceae bacterium]|nr:effector binding domain-containing protein [Lachnospiraceae bacterium]
MKYKEMMEDSLSFIHRQKGKALTMDKVAGLYSYAAPYFGYMFSAYYNMPFSEYMQSDVSNPGLKVRKIDYKQIHMEKVFTDSILMGGRVVVPKRENETDLLKEAEERVLKTDNPDDAQLAMWWHDKECKMYYLMGPVLQDEKDLTEDMIPIRIPSGQYAVFYTDRETDSDQLESTTKMLVKYVLQEWVEENDSKVDRLGYTYERYQGGKIYLYVQMQNKKKTCEDTKSSVYGVDSWIKYIDDHILENPTAQSLADTFHYSVQHFRHIFRLYYDIAVSDYIRKRKLQCAAGELRAGARMLDVSIKYNFKTPAGFTRAFQQEFKMTPSAYRQGEFEVVDLAQYYSKYKDTLTLSFVEMKELKMIGHTVIPNRGEDVDIPAQVHFWLQKDFPCLENTRFSCNKKRREDKIAMWYHDPECINIEYILGPVVEDFEDVPDNMVQVTISAGRYAIFETNRMSDKEDVAETLRMFSRCVFYGWIKEHREKVDLMRFTFERYLDNKVYIYVPVKE